MKFSFLNLIMIAILVAAKSIFPQQKIQTSFDYSEGKIFIFYEFQGDRTKDYEIEIVLKRTGDPSFNLIPENLTGDIGEGKFANKKCKIIWALSPAEETELEGEDFFFEITANELSGGIPWYIYAGGAALAGGTAAVLLLGKKDSNGNGTITPPAGEFPTPPVRP